MCQLSKESSFFVVSFWGGMRVYIQLLYLQVCHNPHYLLWHISGETCVPAYISNCYICWFCYVIFGNECVPISNCYICRFVMSFLMRFPHEDDTVYLAHCYPYRYSGSTIRDNKTDEFSEKVQGGAFQSKKSMLQILDL